MKPVQEVQCTDLFAVAMRNFITSNRKILPRDELVRIDVLRLASQYVLNENDWPLHIDPDSKHLSFNKPALYVPVGIRGEVLNRVHIEAGHTAANKTYAIAKRHFFWPGLYNDARRLQQHCLQCKMARCTHQRKPKPRWRVTCKQQQQAKCGCWIVSTYQNQKMVAI